MSCWWHKGSRDALASLEAEGFTREEASSEFGHRGCEATTLAFLKAEGFTREEASSELGHRGRDGALASLKAQR